MYRIPLGQFVSEGVDWLLKRYGHFFDAFSVGVNAFIHAFKGGLNLLPWWLFILIVATLAWRVKGWRLTVGSTLGLLLIYNMQLWSAFIDTLVLVLISALVSIIIGLPLGIIAARNHRVQRLMYPILDFMQTCLLYTSDAADE